MDIINHNDPAKRTRVRNAAETFHERVVDVVIRCEDDEFTTQELLVLQADAAAALRAVSDCLSRRI